MSMEIFQGRTLIIATKHGKEKVIAPILERELGVTCKLMDGFDTDTLGTFSGEVERTLAPFAAAKEKCLKAMELHNADLAVSSEGSFGPHPSIFFLSADEELLVLIDRKNKIEVAVRELSTDTNFNASEVKTIKELDAFAKQVGFPEHAIILRPSKDVHTDSMKAITAVPEMRAHFKFLIDRYGHAYVETDMRAMHNPSRMKVIGKAAKKLAETLRKTCPNCEMPAFRVSELKRGLPCEQCGSPTRSVRCTVSVCQHCLHRVETEFPDGKTHEEPLWCDFCNP